MQIKDKMLVPRDDYSEITPETGQVFKAKTWGSLVSKVKKYRYANNLPVGPAFVADMEKRFCERRPELCEPPHNSRPNERLDLADVVHGTRVIAEVIWSKVFGERSPIVSQEESNRRAAICASCPQNNPFSKPCYGICAELEALVQRMVSNASTPYDDKLYACNICRCFLKAAVHVDLELQRKAVTPEMDALWPDYCWKRYEELAPKIKTNTGAS